MNDDEWLAERFQAERTHLRAVAYRMLGSISEADDAVQQTWLRLSRADSDSIENLGGVADHRRRPGVPEHAALADVPRGRSRWRCTCPTRWSARSTTMDPEQEALLADSVGLALLVVLDTLAPAERLAFVLHDMFAVPFDDIAADGRPLAGRRPPAGQPGPAPGAGRRGACPTPTWAASARWSTPSSPPPATVTSTRCVAVLDPEVVLRSDGGGRPTATALIRGAAAVAGQALTFSHLSAFVRPGAGQWRRGRRCRAGWPPDVGHGLHRPGRQDRRDRRHQRSRPPPPPGGGASRRPDRVTLGRLPWAAD